MLVLVTKFAINDSWVLAKNIDRELLKIQINKETKEAYTFRLQYSGINWTYSIDAVIHRNCSLSIQLRLECFVIVA